MSTNFSYSMPSDSSAIEIFAGTWVSRLPMVLEHDATSTPLFADDRVNWFLQQYPVNGKKILELGPLEGGHTYMLERGGRRYRN